MRPERPAEARRPQPAPAGSGEGERQASPGPVQGPAQPAPAGLPHSPVQGGVASSETRATVAAFSPTVGRKCGSGGARRRASSAKRNKRGSSVAARLYLLTASAVGNASLERCNSEMSGALERGNFRCTAYLTASTRCESKKHGATKSLGWDGVAGGLLLGGPCKMPDSRIDGCVIDENIPTAGGNLA